MPLVCRTDGLHSSLAVDLLLTPSPALRGTTNPRQNGLTRLRSDPASFFLSCTSLGGVIELQLELSYNVPLPRNDALASDASRSASTEEAWNPQKARSRSPRANEGAYQDLMAKPSLLLPSMERGMQEQSDRQHTLRVRGSHRLTWRHVSHWGPPCDCSTIPKPQSHA
jgi:hypothetical protein